MQKSVVVLFMLSLLWGMSSCSGGLMPMDANGPVALDENGFGNSLGATGGSEESAGGDTEEGSEHNDAESTQGNFQVPMEAGVVGPHTDIAPDSTIVEAEPVNPFDRVRTPSFEIGLELDSAKVVQGFEK